MKKGMNPEAVEQLAQQVDGLVDNMNSVYTGRLGYVTDLDWTGEDRDRYVPEFEDQVGNANRAVCEKLTELAERLRANAAAQRDTSNS
ncbi:uncharacterized protein YukE [Brachybacterium muris]|uniref:WXG100 family type VII secretion target n=3 Tax=Brachybacterium TaxID=43668 RepID=A0A022KUY2_9MICO|nr:hypothetical protein [Brachybacterium muris]EYT47548.1 hypothetical protein D641_0115030 [Brachybacterium muris UCD-AY4]MBM7501379.1 uncharacterized protein YukE [Brachybacterium muris]